MLLVSAAILTQSERLFCLIQFKLVIMAGAVTRPLATFMVRFLDSSGDIRWLPLRSSYIVFFIITSDHPSTPGLLA